MPEQVIDLLVTYKYLLIIPITIVEGPLIMMVCGFLLKLGYFSLVPLYLILMLGDLVGDVWWYFVGYFFGDRFVKRFGKFFSITEEQVTIAKGLFRRYHDPIVLGSKLTMGFGLAIVTLVSAGISKVPFGRYMTLNIIGQFFWTGFLLTLGYLFGHLYSAIDDIFGRIFIISTFLVVFLCVIGFGKYVKSITLKNFS